MAKSKFQQKNLNFECEDIHDLVKKVEEFEIFCLINSLFLLPRPKELLRKISGKLTRNGQLLLLIPNTESENFRRYQKMEPKVNSFILHPANYFDFFEECGLKIISIEGIVKVPFFGRWDTKFLYPFRDKYLFWLEKQNYSDKYSYNIIQLTAI